MAARFRTGLLAFMAAALLPLGACNLVPPEGPSLLAQRPNRNFGPSAQKLDENGYPLLGAFPQQAAPQLDSNAVAQDRQDLLASARSQNGQVRSAAAEYSQSVAEARKIRSQHDADVSRITSVQVRQDAARKSNEDVLRQIEGR